MLSQTNKHMSDWYRHRDLDLAMIYWSPNCSTKHFEHIDPWSQVNEKYDHTNSNSDHGAASLPYDNAIRSASVPQLEEVLLPLVSIKEVHFAAN